MNLTLSPKPKSPDIHSPAIPGIAAYGYDRSSHDGLHAERLLAPGNGEHELGEGSLNNEDGHENDRNIDVC